MLGVKETEAEKMFGIHWEYNLGPLSPLEITLPLCHHHCQPTISWPLIIITFLLNSKAKSV